MKRILLIVGCLLRVVLADTEVDTWILPLRVCYAEGTPDTVWVEHNPSTFYYKYSETLGETKRPLTGKNILFLNKLGSGEKLQASRKLYPLPDGYNFLMYDTTIDLSKVVLIEIIIADSIKPDGIWGSRVVPKATGDAFISQKIIFTDLIITENEAAYCAQHVYCFDNQLTKDIVRQLFSKGGMKNRTLKKAIQERKLVFMEEVTP
jgi:hypothetical protein